MTKQNRTMLANLGFADSDKGETHDLMCNFIVEHADNVRQLLFHEPGGGAHTEVPISKGDGQYKTTIGYLDVVLRGSAVVGRGCIQSKTIDEQCLYRKLATDHKSEFDTLTNELDRLRKIKDSLGYDRNGDVDTALHAAEDSTRRCLKNQQAREIRAEVCVECKTKISSIGDVVRQINTYREYYNKDDVLIVWVLAILEPLSDHEEKLLATERITPIVLTSFHEWVSNLDKVPSKNSLSI